MNKNELEILNKYKKQGYTYLRGGAPDFVFLKTNNGKIKDFIFVEVKYGNDRLSYEQRVYKKILEKLNAKYKLEHIMLAKPRQSGPSQSSTVLARLCQPLPPQNNLVHTIPTHSNSKPNTREVK